MQQHLISAVVRRPDEQFRGDSHELPVLHQSHRHQPLAHLPGPGRSRVALPRAAGPLGRDAEAPQARADRRRADRNGRRQRAAFRGLSRAAQPVARPRQGRRALPPRCEPRGGDGAGGLDDDQERRRGPALRRCQGWHPRRPEAVVEQGTRAHDAPLHQRDRHHHRPAARHSGARREHQPADHGVDDGHLFDEHGLHRHRCRHRQADPSRRLARARS
jgi:hypothetical protein